MIVEQFWAKKAINDIIAGFKWWPFLLPHRVVVIKGFSSYE